MTRLYLTRHGQTEWNLCGRMQGSKDSPLTDQGIYQASQLGKYLENTHLDRVFSSSSQRASHTAELIIGNREIPITKLNELKEMNFGHWEGEYVENIKEKYREQFNTFWTSPHLLQEFPGETFAELRNRVVNAIKMIVDEHINQDVLIVTHAIVLKTLMNYFLNAPLKKLFDDPFVHPTSLSIIEVKEDTYQVLQYAGTDHYSVLIDKE